MIELSLVCFSYASARTRLASGVLNECDDRTNVVSRLGAPFAVLAGARPFAAETFPFPAAPFKCLAILSASRKSSGHPHGAPKLHECAA